MFIYTILPLIYYSSIFILPDRMECVKIAKSNLRSELKKKLSQMSAYEIAKQSKTITEKVNHLIFICNLLMCILILFLLYSKIVFKNSNSF